MKKSIKLPPKVHMLMERLNNDGCQAYAVGGCIRDSVLGRKPNDWDICTDAKPDQIEKLFSDFKCVAVGKAHGTIGVIADGVCYEITTFRQEGGYTDNRHPDWVSFTKDVKQDLARRDFTINAMAYHPDAGLIDPNGGLEDCRMGIVRCVGIPAVRFEEDGLRSLRCVRFASQLGFSIERETEAAVKQQAELLENISRERIGEEWRKAVIGNAAGRILPKFDDLIRLILASDAVKAESLQRLDCLPVDFAVRMAYLLRKAAAPEQILRRLRYSKKCSEQILYLIEHLDIPVPKSETEIRLLLRCEQPEDLQRLWILQGINGGVQDQTQRAAQMLSQILEEGGCRSIRDLAVDGSRLIEAGIPQGRIVGEILNALLEAVIRGNVLNEAEDLTQYAIKLRRQYEMDGESSFA